MSDALGLREAVSIALGGMVGGGIYAVLGVVTSIAGPATWAAFVLAGVVAACAGYSYSCLNSLATDRGGSVTLVQSFTGNTTAAGMAGWTLLFGYVGSMAMYAFAFAEFALAFAVLPRAAAGVPLRPVVSVAVVGGFVALNLLGTRVTGAAENVLVALKVGILVAFGVAGLLYGVTATPDAFRLGGSELASAGPLVAAGVSFVAFQGWQLLFYDQESIVDPEDTISTAVYLAIAVAVVIYVLVAVVTFNLAPDALVAHPHTALKDAAQTVGAVVGLGAVGGTVIALSALFSTGSAINATLFSAGHFAKGMLSADLLPDRAGDGGADGAPDRTILLLGAVTAAFTAAGSLEAITNFASVAFVVVFGAMSVLAFRQRDADAISPLPPAVGAVGSAAFLPLMLAHLYREDVTTFLLVFVLATLTLAVELLYFEREWVADGVRAFEDDVEGALFE
ncbi:MAG: APC family permease [Halobacteriaceae archaeon]